MNPYFEDDAVTIYHGDCREILPQLHDKVGLVLTDPPYNGVRDEEWDNQWLNDAAFLKWLDDVLASANALMADNGTLCVFSSPRLAARLEVQIAQRFRVIGNVVWDKGGGRNGVGGTGVDVTALRTYWTANTERIVIAEKQDGDGIARDASGYWESCEAGKRSVFGEYLKSEFDRAGVASKQIAALFPSVTGGLTGCVSNWLLGLNVPTPVQYATIRHYLNDRGGDYLRREYEDLRREYEDLRRPFFLWPSDQWGDVWRFDIERCRQHPAQKPRPLIGQMVRVSSRPGDTVLDPFMGSGTTLRAAKDLGRKAIGIEIEERYCEIAAKRMAQAVLL